MQIFLNNESVSILQAGSVQYSLDKSYLALLFFNPVVDDIPHP